MGDSGRASVLDQAVDDADKIHYFDLMTVAAHSERCLGMPSDKPQGVALYTDNRKVHNEDRFLVWTDTQRNYLESRGTTFADENFDYIIKHQFGAAAIPWSNAIGEREFSVPMPPDLRGIEKYGNTSTTSYFIVLRDQLSEQRRACAHRFRGHPPVAYPLGSRRRIPLRHFGSRATAGAYRRTRRVQPGARRQGCGCTRHGVLCRHPRRWARSDGT